MLLLRKNKFTIFLALFVLLLPAVFTLFHSGFFLSDDGNWMVIRFSAFYEALRSGQFPVRFLPRLNFGYGYPVADFLYPLFMYLGVPIHILGVNFVNTIKIIFGLSLCISGLGAFLWLRKLVNHTGALIGAVVYVYFPYHIFDVYQRGSLGEALALAIIPLILWQAERRRTIYSAILLACLILSHNSLAVLFLPFILVYFFIRKLFSIKRLLAVLISSLCLSAFFWIPALYDKQFTVFDSVSVSSLQSYFLRPNTYFLLGWISVVSLLLAIPILFIRKNIVFVYFLLLSFFSIFMALPMSDVIWQITKIAPFFQFPYRFLSLTTLGIAFITAVVIGMLPKKMHVISAVLLLVIVCVSSWNMLFPKAFQNYPDSFYSTNQDSTTVKSEYMPRWVQVYPLKRANEIVSIDNKTGTVQVVQNKGSRLIFNAVMKKGGRVTVNIIDFPGWKATVDGKPALISHDNPRGLISFFVPQGTYTVQLVFSETPVRLFADILSLSSLLLIFYIVIKNKHER